MNHDKKYKNILNCIINNNEYCIFNYNENRAFYD